MKGVPKGVYPQSLREPLVDRQDKLRTRLKREAGVDTLTPQTMGAWLEDQITEIQNSENLPAAEKLKAPKFSVKDAIRMFLLEKPLDGPGEGVIRLQHLLQKTYATAVNEKSPFQMAATKVLLEHGFNKPSQAPEEGTAKSKGGIIRVYIDRAERDPDIPMMPDSDPRSQKALPEFLDAEVVE